MMNPHSEPLSESEMEKFRSIPDVQVVIDVGARTSLDYLAVHPDAEYHLFEPHKPFYRFLQDETRDKPNVHVNPYALGETDKVMGYDHTLQALDGGDYNIGVGPWPQHYQIKTLDWYIEENNIQRIDFLKIDTEGYDLKVLQGGKKAVSFARYIQFEHVMNQKDFFDLLEGDFTLEDIGGRNYFCTRKV